MGFNVNKVAGALHITANPYLLWAGYVFHDNTWYAVETKDLVAGKIKASSKIILPEIEHSSGE